VAADMRGSVLPLIFDVPNTTGLSDLLVGGGDPEVVARQPRQADGVELPDLIARRMAVLPSGPHQAHALAVLDSGAMAGLLQSQRESYEFVVLDSPPATAAADAFAIAGGVDGVVVVARAARTRGRSIEELRRRLDQSGAAVIGSVFIGKGKSGRHRHRAQGQSAVRLPVSSPERPAWSTASPDRKSLTAPRQAPGIVDDATISLKRQS
jgi:Mrp family chromosome partitioning ATPase